MYVDVDVFDILIGIEYSPLTLFTILKVRRQGKVRYVDIVDI